MSADRASAVTIIVGSALFLMAAFSPASRVFGTRDPARKLEIIMAAPLQWQIAQALFALGAIVTVVGVGVLAARFAGQKPAVYLYASTVLMGFGALLWSRHVYVRAVSPHLFTSGQLSVWLFAGYSILTLIGLALLGVALLQLGLPPWVGRLAIGSAIVFALLGLAFGDMPPFVYYVVTGTIGIKLVSGIPAP